MQNESNNLENNYPKNHKVKHCMNCKENLKILQHHKEVEQLNNNYKQRFERNQVNEKIVTNSNS
jgi:hypothetical protein